MKKQKNVLNRLTKSIASKKNQHRQNKTKEEDSGKVMLYIILSTQLKNIQMRKIYSQKLSPEH